MSAHIQHTQVIDRPLAAVFHFYADDHVRNHPRWDPDIKLEQISDGPMGVGTIIHRVNSRSGTPVEGTMEVVEYEPNKVISMIIHDGPAEMRGTTIFESLNDHQTSLTVFIEILGMDDSMDKSFLLSRLERSGEIRKQLMETEI
jgi:hypothetical protein